MKYTNLQRQIALAVFHGAEVSKPYNDIKENGKVLLSGLYFYFPKPQLGEVDYCPSMYRNPGSLSKYETDFNWLMSVREKIIDCMYDKDFKRKETNFLKVHDFSLKLFSALITLSAYIEKEWKPYSIYYDLETTDTPKYVEVLFYAFSDFAMLWCLSNGRTEFVELVKEKV